MRHMVSKLEAPVYARYADEFALERIWEGNFNTPRLDKAVWNVLSSEVRYKFTGPDAPILEYSKWTASPDYYGEDILGAWWLAQEINSMDGRPSFGDSTCSIPLVALMPNASRANLTMAERSGCSFIISRAKLSAFS